MIRVLPAFLLCLFCVLISYAQTPLTGEVNSAGDSEPGTVMLNVACYGRGKAALQAAQRMAFETLLFRGIPGSTQSQPLVENESHAKQLNAPYFQELLDQQRFRQFLMQVTPISSSARVAGQKRRIFLMKINVQALRRDLEQNEVIRKLGF